MRAIHVLPGVATGDDLRSEFSVRGLPVRNMNFTFEGISTPLLVHTVQGVQDTGSIAMVNGDVLNEVALAAGSYPQRHGDHTGAELNFLMREGSRDRVRGQFRPSITDTSLVLEGPLGSSKKGSWLISARKSYLGSVIRRIDPENTFAFGFHDAQVKLVRDVTPAHQLQLALTVGRSRLDQDPDVVDRDEVTDGVNDVGVSGAHVAARGVAAIRADSSAGCRRQHIPQRQPGRRGVASRAPQRRDVSRRLDILALGTRDARGRRRGPSIERVPRRAGARAAGTGVRRCARISARRRSPHLRTSSRASCAGARLSRPAFASTIRRLTGHTSASPWIEARCPLGVAVRRASRRGHLPPGAGVRRGKRYARIRSRCHALVSRRARHRRPARGLGHLAGVGLQPRGSRLSLVARRRVSRRERAARSAVVYDAIRELARRSLARRRAARSAPEPQRPLRLGRL